MAKKEYLIFCDESDAGGAYFSNFYGVGNGRLLAV